MMVIFISGEFGEEGPSVACWSPRRGRSQREGETWKHNWRFSVISDRIRCAREFSLREELKGAGLIGENRVFSVYELDRERIGLIPERGNKKGRLRSSERKGSLSGGVRWKFVGGGEGTRVSLFPGKIIADLWTKKKGKAPEAVIFISRSFLPLFWIVFAIDKYKLRIDFWLRSLLSSGMLSSPRNVFPVLLTKGKYLSTFAAPFPDSADAADGNPAREAKRPGKGLRRPGRGCDKNREDKFNGEIHCRRRQVGRWVAGYRK